MENGGQSQLPAGKPVVIGELPWQLLGFENRRLLVVAVPREIKFGLGEAANDWLVEAVAAAASALISPSPEPAGTEEVIDKLLKPPEPN